MAETLISPGVLARENDQSQITSQPVQAGAAIIGPTVLGPVNVPTLVTSYSEYLATFGSSFLSGSDSYSFFTSISANNYFANGGTSLLVTRVVSGSFTNATSSNIYNNLETGNLNIINLTGSINTGFSDLVNASYTVTPACSNGSAIVPAMDVVVSNTSSVASIIPQASGSDFAIGDVLTFTSQSLGGGGSLSGLSNATAIGSGSATGVYNNVSASGGTPASVNGTAYANITTTNNGNISASAQQTTIGGTSTGYNSSAAGDSSALAATSTTGTGTGVTWILTCDASGVVVACTASSLAAGNGQYAVGDVLTFSAADMNSAFAGAAGTGDATVAITSAMLQSYVSGIAVSVPGAGYAVGEVLTFAANGIGLDTPQAYTLVAGDFAVGTDVTVTLNAGQINNEVAFVLESLGEGKVLNSDSPESAKGALASGSANNFRWEIQAPDTAQGVFSLIIRQGNDNQKNKSVLETFPNVSLDPKQSNYIGRVVGDMKKTLMGAGTAEPYIQDVGNYRNSSRYVRVKEVKYKTPNYFDNDGVAKSEFTSSIPVAMSGTFGDAEGDIVKAGDLYYNDMSGAGAQNQFNQGLSGSDYNDSINLLANKDDYNYNVISVPGLIHGYGTNATPINSLISNCSSRGDCIAIIDMQGYGSSVTLTTAQAAGIDNSYAATYWPWVQITEPDTGHLVWIPGSTLIPGVYAYNDKAAEAWFAPAGINRGGLGTVLQAERKLTQSQRDSLYTGKVNPIATFPGKGVVVFGQKTLQTKASALDRVNVRRLLIELKSYISQISDNLVFEQNTAATRNQFLSQVNPYLESVQQRQGLYAFKVVMDSSNNGPEVIDRNQLVGAIYLQPTKTAEFIYLDFNILPTGATFPA